MHALTRRTRTGAEVTVKCQGAPRFTNGYVEVTGVVHDAATIQATFMVQFSDGFDLTTYEQVVDQINRFPNLYPVEAN